MKATTDRLFSFSEAETEQYPIKQDKIELVSCPRKNMICQEHLSVVNKCYVESEQYFRDKDYQRSIDTLKTAFYKTTELAGSPCSNCANLFRSTIADSIEDIHGDLKKMASGLFSKKRLQTSCMKAANLLEEFEKVQLHESFKIDESKKRFINNYANQKVS